MWHRRPAYLIVAICFALSLAACDRDHADDTTGIDAEPESVLRRGNGGDPNSLDPLLAEDEHAFRVLTDLYEGLVILDPSGAITPGVAAEWHVSDDGRIYTFRLRRDAAWSDGRPVTSNDFIAAFRRVLARDSGSAYAFLLYPIRNAEAIQLGQLPVTELGLSAPSDETLVIELESSTPHFLSALAMPVAFPLPPATSESVRRFADPEQFVGNGPYVLEEWQPGHRVRLRKNPLFREARSVAIDSVEYYAVTNLQSEFNMYRTGELHITASIPASHIREMRAERPEEIRIVPKLGLYYLAFDLSEEPTDDPALRKALSLAIDREALADVIGRGELPAYGLVPEGIAGYEPARYEWRSLTDDAREMEARRSFESSSLADARSPKLKLVYDTGDIHEKVALAVSGMWRDVLGIDVELDKREWQYFLDTRDRRDEWQVMRFAWIGDYSHPNTFTELFRSDSPQNLPLYRDPDYDARLAEARSVLDTEEQAVIIADAEATLLNDYPLAPLYFYVSKHMVSPAVQGFYDNALDRHPSRYLSLSHPQSAP